MWWVGLWRLGWVPIRLWVVDQAMGYYGCGVLTCGGWDGSVWLCLWSSSWVMARRRLGEVCYFVKSAMAW